MKRLVILVLLAVAYSVQGHPLKLSVTDVVYEEHKVKVKFKFFIDDFNACYSNFIKKGFDFVQYNGKEIDSPTQKRIAQYVNSHFLLNIDGKAVNLNLKRAYVDQEKLFTDYAVIYVEMLAPVANIQNAKLLTLKNELMFETIPEQKNIVNIILSDEKRTIEFENGRETIKEIHMKD